MEVKQNFTLKRSKMDFNGVGLPIRDTIDKNRIVEITAPRPKRYISDVFMAS